LIDYDGNSLELITVVIDTATLPAASSVSGMLISIHFVIGSGCGYIS